MAEVKDYFKTFCKLSRSFGTAATQDDLLGLIVQYAIDTMDGKAACLFLADDRHDFFVPMIQKGLSANYLHANPLKVKGVVQTLLKKGYLSFRDATADPRLENHEAKKNRRDRFDLDSSSYGRRSNDRRTLVIYSNPAGLFFR